MSKIIKEVSKKNTWFLYVYIFIATASLPLLCLPTCWLLRAQYPLLGTIRNVVLEFIPDNRIVTTLPPTCFVRCRAVCIVRCGSNRQHAYMTLFKLSRQALEAVIGEHDYQHNRVNQWTNLVLEQCLSQLTKLWKPFKYIGTCAAACQQYYYCASWALLCVLKDSVLSPPQ